MTKNTDLHVAMPELPDLELAIAHGATTRTVSDTGRTVVEFYTDELDAYTRAAIEQAAGVVPEGYAQRVIDELYENGDPVSVDAAELLTQMLAASPAPPKQRPALGRGECGGATLPTPPAQRWQFGTWTLTAPDGRTWKADSPLKACSAEQRDRIPPEVALKRIFDALDDGEKS